MHTMVVTMSLDPDRPQEAAAHLQHDIVPWATRQAGFVSGQWLRSADGSRGLGVVVFQTEPDAQTAAHGPRNYRRDGARAWNIEAVDIFEQASHA
jgi:hypothetical protein